MYFYANLSRVWCNRLLGDTAVRRGSGPAGSSLRWTTATDRHSRRLRTLRLLAGKHTQTYIAFVRFAIFCYYWYPLLPYLVSRGKRKL